MATKQHNPQQLSYLSPQHYPLRKTQTILSPKYDRKKALQNQIQRKRITQQKLLRFNQYNSLIMAKALQKINLQPSNIYFQNTKKEKTLREPNNSNCQRRFFQNNENKFIKITKNTGEKQIKNRNQYLDYIKSENIKLNNKKYELSNYLRQLNEGVEQLEEVFNQVYMTHKSVKKFNDQQKFKGLWITDEQKVLDQSIYNQKHTRQTIQFQSEKRFRQNDDFVQNQMILYQKNQRDHQGNYSKNNRLQIQYSENYPNHMINQNNQDMLQQYKQQQIQFLQNKFKKLVKKLETKKSCFPIRQHQKRNKMNFKYNESAQLTQLDEIQTELDQLRSIVSDSHNKNYGISSKNSSQVNNKTKKYIQTPTNCIKYIDKDLKNIKPFSINHSTSSMISKVKSLGNLKVY